MKKTLLMVAAFVAAVCGSSTLFGQKVDVNGDFQKINAKTNLPANWTKNGGGAKEAVCKLEKAGKKNILKISSPGKYFTLYYTVRIPAKAGDTFKMTIKAKGKANMLAGYYSYSLPKGSHLQTKSFPLKVDSPAQFKEYVTTMTVSAVEKGDVGFIYPHFGSYSKFDVEIESVTFERVPAAAKK